MNALTVLKVVRSEPSAWSHVFHPFIKMGEEAKARGNEEYKRGNYEAAISHYTQAITLSPSEPAYYGNRSAAYFMIQKYEEALQDCRTGLSLQPEFLKLTLRAGKCSLALGNFEEAKKYYQDATNLEPENETVKADVKAFDATVENEHMFNQCRKNEQYPQANYFLDQLLAVVSQSLPYKLKKLELLIEGMQPKEAFEYAKALPSQDVSVVTLKGIALYYMSATFTDQAKGILREAVRLDPDNERARRVFRTIGEMERLKEEGNRHFQAGRSAEAVELYTQALELDPKHKLFNATILANRAAAYMKSKDYMKALEDCNKAISLNPDYTRAYLRRGNVNMELEYYEEALHDYNKVKDMEPNTSEIDNYIYFAKDKAKKVGKKDYYKILGVEKGVSDDQLKRAYRQLALKWHPDKNAETPEKRAHAEKMFKDVNEAYAVLNDREKRQRYDMGMDVDGPDFGGMGGFGGVDPTQIFQMFFGGGGGDAGGFPGFGGFSSGGSHFGGSPFGFGGGRPGSAGFPGGVRFNYSRR